MTKKELEQRLIRFAVNTTEFVVEVNKPLDMDSGSWIMDDGRWTLEHLMVYEPLLLNSTIIGIIAIFDNYCIYCYI